MGKEVSGLWYATQKSNRLIIRIVLLQIIRWFWVDTNSILLRAGDSMHNRIQFDLFCRLDMVLYSIFQEMEQGTS